MNKPENAALNRTVSPKRAAMSPRTIARRRLVTLTMLGLIQPHLCPSHKNELSYYPFGSEQILRFPQKVSQEGGVTEIEGLMLLRLWRIDLAIKILRETDDCPAGARQ